ncbi:MAG: hypothetical protein U0Z26_16440 [Anaerolineales bacterium]
MWRSFSQPIKLPENKSPEEMEQYFREQKLSGVLEKRINGKPLALLMASGAPVGTYSLENDIATHISHSDFSATSYQEFQASHLPDNVARMVWLTLESKLKEKIVLNNSESWKSQQEKLRTSSWSGLLEIYSDSLHGIAFLNHGEENKTEAIFQDSTGFSNNFTFMEEASHYPCEATLFETSSASQAYQCYILHKGTIDWADKLLERYKEMVGSKMLQLMGRELNRSISPWRWNIVLQNTSLIDAHFFPNLESAAHAYRAIFMGMGTQMNFFIGNILTQRLLNETYEQLFPEEKDSLKSQRLIPAAFTE